MIWMSKNKRQPPSPPARCTIDQIFGLPQCSSVSNIVDISVTTLSLPFNLHHFGYTYMASSAFTKLYSLGNVGKFPSFHPHPAEPKALASPLSQLMNPRQEQVYAYCIISHPHLLFVLFSRRISTFFLYPTAVLHVWFVFG